MTLWPLLPLAQALPLDDHHPLPLALWPDSRPAGQTRTWKRLTPPSRPCLPILCSFRLAASMAFPVGGSPLGQDRGMGHVWLGDRDRRQDGGASPHLFWAGRTVTMRGWAWWVVRVCVCWKPLMRKSPDPSLLPALQPSLPLKDLSLFLFKHCCGVSQT